MMTPRDLDVLKALVRYYVLNRQQVQHLVFPNDPNGRVTCRRLQWLVEQHLINRQGTLFCHPSAGSAAPVYYPARKGCELLAEHFDDPSYLLTPTQAPIPHHTFHWLAVSDTHIAFDEAIELQNTEHPKRNGTSGDHRKTQIASWINEWDIVNKDETVPEKRFQLYTLVRETPRLVCAPDAGFLLTCQGHAKVFYLEQDRNTSGVTQIAAGKTQGFAVMAETRLHRRHFPEATVESFTVLMIAPTPRRRDSLRKAIKDKPGAALWRFAAVGDVTADKTLHFPIWYPCGDEEPKPLVRP
jgi:hypothetical protein